MKIDNLVEHEDKSATIQVTLDSEETHLLIELALTMLISNTAIENQRLNIWEKAVEEVDPTN